MNPENGYESSSSSTLGNKITANVNNLLKETKTNAVDRATTSLDQAIQKNGELIKILSERISPILLSEFPTDSTGEGFERAVASPHVEVIYGLESNVNRQNRQLQDLLERLDF